MRFVLEILLVFLLPFLLFFVFAKFSKREERKGGIWEDAPVSILAGISIASVAAAILYYASTESGSREGIYRPARIENGKVIPGGFETPEMPKKTEK